MSREKHKFIFVCGLHRSGTSLLAKCLMDHPGISGFHDTGVPMDEGQFLQTVYPQRGEPGGDGCGRFGFDPRSHLTENSPLAKPEKAEELFSQWVEHWDLNKEILLEKSPPNLIRARYLQACFPNSYFIFITRHPVANAIATKKWTTKIPRIIIILHWIVCHYIAEQDQGLLKNVLTIKYEDFVKGPKSYLDKIGEFVGVGEIPLYKEVNPDINTKYFEQWNELRSSYLGNSYTKLMSTLFESHINRFGYSFQDIAS